MATIQHPFGTAQIIALTATGAQAITIRNAFTVIDGETVEASGNRTINLTIASGIGVGAEILVKAKTAGTQTTTFGTGMLGAALTGVAGKTIVARFIYDGTRFIGIGQVD